MVTLVVTDNAGSTSSPRSATVSVVDPNNQPPTADFSADCEYNFCDFRDLSTDPGGSIVAWNWSYGDGFGSTSKDPFHIYNSPGTYTVTLVVTDNGGLTATAQQQVTLGSNTPPTADFSSSCTGLSCTFTDASTDSDGTVTGWSWTFGDGGTSTQRNPTHAYAAAGNYPVTLTATDNAGATHSATRTASVTEPLTLSLTATKQKRRGANGALLQWSPTVAVNVWRSLGGAAATVIATGVGGGEYWDPQGKGKGSTGSRTYFVCSTADPSTCSNQATVTF
jgi:PKD repeat protein